MKVKTFGSAITQDRADESLLESDINNWLSENPDIEVVDIKFTVCDSDGILPGFAAFALVMYKESSQ